MTMADDYVNSVLDRMPLVTPRRTQIGTELHGHIAERVAAGHPMDEVLRQLGDPAALAQSYLAEVPLVPAPHGRRLAAKLVDALAFILLFLFVVAGSWGISKLLIKPGLFMILGAPAVLLVVFGFGVYVILAEWKEGRTLGKRLFGLLVVQESGARIGFGQSVVRQLPAFFQVFWIDAMFALFTDRRQRAFELLSKTRVIDATLLP